MTMLSAHDIRVPFPVNILRNKSLSERAHILNHREDHITWFRYEKVRLSEVVKDTYCLKYYPEARNERLDI